MLFGLQARHGCVRNVDGGGRREEFRLEQRTQVQLVRASRVHVHIYTPTHMHVKYFVSGGALIAVTPPTRGNRRLGGVNTSRNSLFMSDVHFLIFFCERQRHQLTVGTL